MARKPARRTLRKFKDVYPGIMDVAACFHTKVVTTSDSARLPGAIALGFDHRLIDGAVADQFLSHVKKTLEGWVLSQG